MTPLKGLRVVSIEQYGAGPYGTMQLADLGADVIKIENHSDGGDMSRSVGPYFTDGGESYFFHSFNRNKRSMALDLKKPGAKRVLEALVAQSDAVMNNLRGDLPEKLGLTYSHLGQVKPSIVCVSLSAYGRTGERSSWPGYDYLMQAEAGYLSLTGEPGTPPARFGLSVVDMMSGLFAAFSVLAGVHEARSTGKGRDIDVNLFDCALQNLNYLATWQLNHGVNQGRLPRSAHPSLTPSQLYTTADGFIFVMCNKEKFWPALCQALGAAELADDPRFRRFPKRLENRDALNLIIEERMKQRTTQDWLDRFAGVVPAAPVNDVRAALENPFVTEAGRIHTFHADGAAIKMVRAPYEGEFDLPDAAGPRLGQHTSEILEMLGFSADEIGRLAVDGVVAAPHAPAA